MKRILARGFFCATIVLIGFHSTGATVERVSFVHPSRSCEQAKREVEEFLTAEKGLDLKQFEIVNFGYEYKNGVWSFLYSGIGMPIGSHFLVQMKEHGEPKFKMVGGA